MNTDDVGLPPGTVFGVAVDTSVKVSGTRSLPGALLTLLGCFILGGQHYRTTLVFFSVGFAGGRRICSDIFRLSVAIALHIRIDLPRRNGWTAYGQARRWIF